MEEPDSECEQDDVREKCRKAVEGLHTYFEVVRDDPLPEQVLRDCWRIASREVRVQVEHPTTFFGNLFAKVVRLAQSHGVSNCPTPTFIERHRRQILELYRDRTILPIIGDEDSRMIGVLGTDFATRLYKIQLMCIDQDLEEVFIRADIDVSDNTEFAHGWVGIASFHQESRALERELNAFEQTVLLMKAAFHMVNSISSKNAHAQASIDIMRTIRRKPSLNTPPIPKLVQRCWKIMQGMVTAFRWHAVNFSDEDRNLSYPYELVHTLFSSLMYEAAFGLGTVIESATVEKLINDWAFVEAHSCEFLKTLKLIIELRPKNPSFWRLAFDICRAVFKNSSYCQGIKEICLSSLMLCNHGFAKQVAGEELFEVARHIEQPLELYEHHYPHIHFWRVTDLENGKTVPNIVCNGFLSNLRRYQHIYGELFPGGKMRLRWLKVVCIMIRTNNDPEFIDETRRFLKQIHRLIFIQFRNDGGLADMPVFNDLSERPLDATTEQIFRFVIYEIIHSDVISDSIDLISLLSEHKNELISPLLRVYQRKFENGKTLDENEFLKMMEYTRFLMSELIQMDPEHNNWHQLECFEQCLDVAVFAERFLIGAANSYTEHPVANDSVEIYKNFFVFFNLKIFSYISKFNDNPNVPVHSKKGHINEIKSALAAFISGSMFHTILVFRRNLPKSLYEKHDLVADFCVAIEESYEHIEENQKLRMSIFMATRFAEKYSVMLQYRDDFSQYYIVSMYLLMDIFLHKYFIKLLKKSAHGGGELCEIEMRDLFKHYSLRLHQLPLTMHYFDIAKYLGTTESPFFTMAVDGLIRTSVTRVADIVKLFRFSDDLKQVFLAKKLRFLAWNMIRMPSQWMVSPSFAFYTKICRGPNNHGEENLVTVEEGLTVTLWALPSCAVFSQEGDDDKHVGTGLASMIIRIGSYSYGLMVFPNKANVYFQFENNNSSSFRTCKVDYKKWILVTIHICKEGEGITMTSRVNKKRHTQKLVYCPGEINWECSMESNEMLVTGVEVFKGRLTEKECLVLQKGGPINEGIGDLKRTFNVAEVMSKTAVTGRLTQKDYEDTIDSLAVKEREWYNIVDARAVANIHISDKNGTSVFKVKQPKWAEKTSQADNYTAETNNMHNLLAHNSTQIIGRQICPIYTTSFELAMAGGVQGFLYLFGQTVLRNGSIEVQNELLRLCLLLFREPTEHAIRHDLSNFRTTLVGICAFSPAQIDMDTIETFFEHILTQPKRHAVEFENDDPTQITSTTGVIRDSELLTLLLSNVAMWESRPCEYASLIRTLVYTLSIFDKGVVAFNCAALNEHRLLFRICDFLAMTCMRDVWKSSQVFCAEQMRIILENLLLNMDEHEKTEAFKKMLECYLALQPLRSVVFNDKPLRLLHTIRQPANGSAVPLTKRVPGKSSKFADPKEEDENDEVDKVNPMMSKVAAWPRSIRSVLISIMDPQLQNMSDSSASYCFNDVEPEEILVTLNAVTDATMISQIISFYVSVLLRLSNERKQGVLNTYQLRLMTSFLRGRECDYHAAGHLFSLIFQERVSIVAGFDYGHIQTVKVNNIGLEAIGPLFAIFEGCVRNLQNFTCVCSSINKVFLSHDQLQQAMCDRGLAEVMVNVFMLLSQEPEEGRAYAEHLPAMKQCWFELASSIILTGFSYCENYLFQTAFYLLEAMTVADLEEYPIEAPDNSMDAQKGAVRFYTSDLLRLATNSCRGLLDADANKHRSASAASSTVGSQSSGSDVSAELSVPFSNRKEKVTSLANELNRVEPIYMRVHKNGCFGPLDCCYNSREKHRVASAAEIGKRVALIVNLGANFLQLQTPFHEVHTEEMEYFESFVRFVASVSHPEAPNFRAPWFGIALKESKQGIIDLVSNLTLECARKVRANAGHRFDRENQSFIKRKFFLLSTIREIVQPKHLKAFFETSPMKLATTTAGLKESLSLGVEGDQYLIEARQFLSVIEQKDDGRNDGENEAMVTYMSSRSMTMSALHSRVEERQRLSASEENPIAMGYKVFNLFEPRCVHLMHEATKAVDLQTITLQFEDLIVWLQRLPRQNQVLQKKFAHPLSYFWSKTNWSKLKVISNFEGPCREKIRMVYGKVDIVDRLLLHPKRSAYVNNLKNIDVNANRVPIDDPSMNKVTLLINNEQYHGQIRCTKEDIQFVSPDYLDAVEEVPTRVELKDITEVYERMYFEHNALEVFFRNTSFYFIFKEKELFEEVASFLSAYKVDLNTKKRDLLENWRNNKITNFEFLMGLNTIAGRSYNAENHHIMPFVIADYQSETLDLTKLTSYRDLTKPISIQDSSMEPYFISNYNNYKTTHKEEESKNGADLALQFLPHHYSSLYSNQSIVAHLMIRAWPMTKLAIKLQDGNFDLPDRMFQSMQSLYRLATTDSKTDFKELIPEMYSLQEMYKNSINLQFEKKQDGQKVDDVVLPPWAWKSPRIFLLAMRQALESPFVSKQLNEWVDLIFGYKQKGKSAIKAINVFHPMTYTENKLSEDGKKNSELNNALITMRLQYGQVPNQLFVSPVPPKVRHPARSQTFILEDLDINGLSIGSQIGTEDMALEATYYFKFDEVHTYSTEITPIIGPKGTTYCLHPTICAVAEVDGKPFYGMSHIDDFPKGYFPAVIANSVVLPKPSDPFVCISSSTDHNFVAFVGITGVVELRRFDTRDHFSTPVIYQFYTSGRTTFFKFCTPFGVGVAGCESGNLSVWDLYTGRLVAFLNSSEPVPTMIRMCSSAQKEKLSCMSVNQKNGEIIIIQSIHKDTIASVYSVNLEFMTSTKLATQTGVKSMSLNAVDPGLGISCIAISFNDSHEIQILETVCLSVIYTFAGTDSLASINMVSYLSPTKLAVFDSKGRLKIWTTKRDVTKTAFTSLLNFSTNPFYLIQKSN